LEIAPHKGEAAEDRYVAGDDGERCGTQPPGGQSPVPAAEQCRLIVHTTHGTG